MKQIIQVCRRKFLILATSSTVANPLFAFAGANLKDIHVVKNQQCGCCSAWVKILKNQGFVVTSEDRSASLLAEFKIKSGIPKNMMSCHTAKIGRYFVEGHVPGSDIKRLIAESPDALGLAVPAMPYGSPGMGPEEEREAFDVFLVGNDGATEVFQHYPEGEIPV